jgi:large subunit ribosomal protein L10
MFLHCCKNDCLHYVKQNIGVEMPSTKNFEIIKSLIKKFEIMKGFILIDYHGLTADELSYFRSMLYPLNSKCTIAKNNLIKMALVKVGIKFENDIFGPTAIIFEFGNDEDNIVSIAKVIMSFAKKHLNFKIKSGFIDGKFINATVFENLSTIPKKEILLAKMLFSMNFTVIKFINTLMININKLVVVLNLISKKKN